jgi:integrase
MNSMQTDSSISTPTAISPTFPEQSAAWIHELESRKRKPVSPATLAAFNSYVKRLLPIVGPQTPLADIDNGFVRDLVTKLVAEKLSPKTIAELVATVKQIVASAVDGNGNHLFPRQWNHKFLDLPQITNQKQPCATKTDVETCIKNSRNDQEQLLYALLVGSGLRIAEALAIHVSGDDKQTMWDSNSSTISVKSSVYRGKEHNRVKTLAAVRTIDLDPRLNDMIARFVAKNNIQTGQLLFQSRNGGPMGLKTATDRLKKHGVQGFHAFRRFRATRLREVGISEEIIRCWLGHADQTISDRYSKLAENVELRKQLAARASLGFAIITAAHPEPSPTKKPNPPKLPKSPRNTTQSNVTAEPAEPMYQATDDDLDPMFFAQPVQEQV